MTYHRIKYAASNRKPRDIVVKYPGKCGCCGAEIKAGEVATYYPPGTCGNKEGRIGHVGGLEGASARCTEEIRKRDFPEYAVEVARREAEQRAVNDYAGDGLDERWEDDCRDICGL